MTETRPRQLALPEGSVYDNLRASAGRYPQQPAIIYYDSILSYRRLLAEVDALAGFLCTELGVVRGERVLLDMQNSPQYIIAFYAIARANAVVVPVNPMNRCQELRFMAHDTGARVALCGQELVDQLRPLLQEGTLRHIIAAAYADYLETPTDLELPADVAAPRRGLRTPGILPWTDALANAAAPPAHQSRADDWCAIPYSSGTTGQPKGCLHTHRGVNFVLEAYTAWFGITSKAVFLTSLPLFHVTGMQNSMNLPIRTGAAMVVMSRWDRRVAARLIERYRVSHWRSITAMAIDFVADPQFDAWDLSSLISIGGGGAAMPAALAARLEQRTGLRYIEGYGLTEAISATHINPPEAPRAACLGIPLFNVDSRIIDPDTLTQLGAGERGEIVVHGPQVFQGYWNNPRATAAAFIELDGKSFLRTGDLGYRDPAGYFYMVDRLKRMINASGYKVWPAEVEAVMQAHPGIQEVCIIATPDPRRGESVKAVIVPRPDQRPPAAGDLQAWCRKHLAAYKVPAQIEFTKTLPHSGSGKILWRRLQELEYSRAGA